MGEAGGTEQLPWRHPKARFFGAPPRFFAQEQRNGVERAVGATNYLPRKRRTRTIPRQPPAPPQSRARNIPTTDLQRSREWWSRRGKKSAFLWRLDTVSFGKTKEMGSKGSRRQRPPPNVSAHPHQGAKKGPPSGGHLISNAKPRDGYPSRGGRGRRFRTLGLRFWRPSLCQLSYSPIQALGYYMTYPAPCQAKC